MSIDVTPTGTRGFQPPRLPGPLMTALLAVTRLVTRALGDRMRVMGRPVLELETIGARTGQRRTAIVGWFPDPGTNGESWLVIASYAGSARHPAWFLNLAKKPDAVRVRIGGRRWKVRPESLRGAERAEAWQRVGSLAPGYAAYQQKTDREIPIVRLRAVEEDRA